MNKVKKQARAVWESLTVRGRNVVPGLNRANAFAVALMGLALTMAASHAEVDAAFTTAVTDAGTFWTTIKTLSIGVVLFVILRRYLRKA